MSIQKSVAVLGGSGGLGQTVCLRVARDAALTVGFYKGSQRAEELVAKITASGGKAIAAQVDIADPCSVKNFFEQAKKNWGRLDSIISVTGPSLELGPIVEVSNDLFKSIIETDVVGAFNVVKYGVPILREEKNSDKSLLLFLCAAVTRTTDFDGLSYIPKKCVEGIIRLVAREEGPSGIRINGLAPGVINAGIVLTDFEGTKYGERIINNVMHQVPLTRKGEASEIADVSAFLISSQSSYVTGQIIAVDGGYTA